MSVTRTEVGECRQCRSFCDKMVEPRGCIELGCRFLYSYVDRLDGRQYVGCMQEVFGAQVDLAAVLEKGGFGGVKMTGDAAAALPVHGRAGLQRGRRVLRLRQPPLLRLHR